MMGSVLDALTEVDWASEAHAYGPADDVPDLLTAVAAGGADADEAIDELFGSVWHQGTVYSASPHVVPFLAELVRSGALSIRQRTQVVVLLHSIGTGIGARQGDPHVDEFDGPDLEAVLAAEADVVARCRAAVAAAAADLLGGMDRLPPRLKPAVAILAVALPHLDGRATDALAVLRRDVGPFGAAVIDAIGEVVATGRLAGTTVRRLTALDEDLRAYAAWNVDDADEGVARDDLFVDEALLRLVSVEGVMSDDRHDD